MKIGDQFTQGTYKTIYSLVSMGFTREVYVFNVSESKILSTFKGQVKDIENITEEEFLQITGSAKEYMDQWARLDGSPLFPEETYNIGDIFVMTDTGAVNYRPDPDERYMLVQVNGIKALVSLTTGNYWMTGKEMGFTIKKDDLKAISGRATFEKVKQRV